MPARRQAVKRFPHQLVVTVADPMNEYVRNRADDMNESVAEVLRDLIDAGIEAKREKAPSSV